MVAEEYRTGVRTTTNGDSIGLPLVSLALALAVLWLLTNAVIAAVLGWRQRAGASRASSRPAA